MFLVFCHRGAMLRVGTFPFSARPLRPFPVEPFPVGITMITDIVVIRMLIVLTLLRRHVVLWICGVFTT